MLKAILLFYHSEAIEIEHLKLVKMDLGFRLKVFFFYFILYCLF